MTLPTAKLTEWLRSRGRHGDTMLAHINPEEARLLKQLGGSGTINPDTGLREYFGDASDHDSNSGNTGADSDNSSGGDRGGGGYEGMDSYGGFGAPAPGPSPATASENQRAAARETQTNRAVVTDSYGRPVHSDFSSSGFVDSGMSIGPNGRTAFSGYAPSSGQYGPPSEQYGPPVAGVPSWADYDMMFDDEQQAVQDEYGPPDYDNPLGPFAGGMSYTDQSDIAEAAAIEADSGFGDMVADFVFSPNNKVYDEQGVPHMATHAYDFFNSGLTQAFAGALAPALGGAYSIGKSIANNNPAELAFGALNSIAEPFSFVDLATKAGSHFGVGEDLSFSDLSPSSIGDSLSGFDLASLGEDITGMFAGLDTSTGASLTGGSANDTFGGGADNYGTPAPATSDGGVDTWQAADPNAVPSLFTMLGDQLAQDNSQWYGGKRFFDEGEQIDIGDNYGLA